MRTKRATSGTIRYQLESDDGIRTITLLIDYSISASYAAKINGDPDSCYPAEGGEVEIGDILATAVEFCNEEGEVARVFRDLLPAYQASIVAEFVRAMDADHSLYEQVVEQCVDHADRSSEYGGD